MSTRRFTEATPPVRVLAAMGAVLVLLLALVVTAGRAGAAPVTVSGGSVDWGVKSSFRSYIAGPAAGSVSTSGGVTTNLDGSFHFTVGSGSLDAATPSIDLATGGGVRFLGHEGALDVQLNDLRVDVDGTSGTLIVDATSLSFPGGVLGTYDDVAVATLDLTGVIPSGGSGSHSWAGVPATLTAAGVPVFAGFYPAGTALDPVSFTATFSTGPTSTSTTSTSTTSTSTTSASTTSTSTTVPDGSTTTTSSIVPGPDNGITGGHLDWGFKESFRNYIATVAAGTTTTDGGATTNVDGTFRFPAATGTASPDGETFDATFEGSVHFSGHDGLLDLVVGGIEAHADGDEGVLVADVTSLPLSGGDTVTYDDVELATLDLSGVTPGSNGLTVTWADIGAVLSDAGAPAFAGFYTAGTPLDPADVVLEVEATTVPPGDGGSGTGDAATVDKTVVAPGDTLTVAGAGFTPGEQVEVWLHSDPQWVGTTVADSSGAVSFAFAIPADLEAGQHHVELIGISSGLILDTAVFTVTAGAGSGAAGSVTPSGSLPYTGGDSIPVVVSGALLLSAGLGLALIARRRVRTA